MIFIEIVGGVVDSVSTTTQEESDLINKMGIVVVDYDDEGTEEVLKSVTFKNGWKAEAVVHEDYSTVTSIKAIEGYEWAS